MPNQDYVDQKNDEIAACETELEEIDASRLAAIKMWRDRGKVVMARRNQLIAQRELHLRENPTPVLGLPNQERLDRLRIQAGVAVLGVKVK